jgi:hypothetical protein
VAALIGWTAIVVLLQTFKGAGVGGMQCRTDPACGEVGWIPPAAWLIGILVIVGVAWWTRRRDAAS